MKYGLTIFFFLSFITGIAQDTLEQTKKLTYAGYLKELMILRFNGNLEQSYFTNLVHNRVNLKWAPAPAIRGRLEIRNRLYTGSDVNSTPDFTKQLRNNNEAVNLSILWFSGENTVLHSNIERLWMEFRKDRWNVRAGRQRINWGMTNTWNPNDIFNSYNFLDFDYEERPGSDAAKFQYILNDKSNIEVAVAATHLHAISAFKYAVNFSKYDFHILSGVYQKAFTAGIGWAGGIADAGFKGEAQFFSKGNDSLYRFNATMELDYIFKSGWYFSGAVLYNLRGIDEPVTDFSAVNFQFTPDNLMPAKWNMIFNTSKEFIQLFSGTMSIVYSPGMKMLILFPTFNYNLRPNIDVDLVWQSFFMQQKTFNAITHNGFLRFKWSF